MAQNVTGLTATDYHEQTVRNYSGQIIISLSVVAFESYCRLFDKKWYEAYKEILDNEKAAKAREQIRSLDLQEDFFLKLKRSQSQDSMKGRIDKFTQGDDLNAYAVAVAFRNAFSHGKLGSLAQTDSLAHILRALILESVKDDCERRIHSIKTF